MIASPISSATSELFIYNFREPLEKCMVEANLYLKKAKVKNGMQNRLLNFFSDESNGYQYSGQLAEATPLPPAMKDLLFKVNKFLKDKIKDFQDFNGILVNKYETGEHYIGKHSDSTKGIVGPIATLAIGHPRTFRIRSKKTGAILANVLSPALDKSYNLMVMQGEFQSEFTHEIPKEKKIKHARMSFTFRTHTNKKKIPFWK